ncbi:glutathione S-transferase theta-2-like isoform X1 [Notamacropus eugenii]|uniref:glutathione S-transferase theta-2-like isoform X1 n=1 Tax=Notamacropus eugenii TaxID=9315 RepID=UPI003B67319C
MSLKLYLDFLSQPCRVLYFFAKVNRIPFELQTVELFRGQHLTDDFAKVNRLKRLPAMKDGDFTLAESVAILHYLSQKYKTPDHWFPTDLQARARVEEYLYWHGDSIRGTLGTVLWIQVLGPLIDVHVPKEKVDKNRAFITKLLQHLEQSFLQDKPFLTGDQISVADLMALEELMQVWGTDSVLRWRRRRLEAKGICPESEAVYAGFDVFEGRPKLAAWCGRVEAILGEKLCQETREALHKLCAEPTTLKDIPSSIKDWMMLRISKIP